MEFVDWYHDSAGRERHRIGGLLGLHWTQQTPWTQLELTDSSDSKDPLDSEDYLDSDLYLLVASNSKFIQTLLIRTLFWQAYH
jgi:hypothetical protein